MSRSCRPCLLLLASLAACFTPTTEARFEVPDGGARGRDGGCRPSCGDRQCGGDGCGGVCGTCPAGTVCNGGRCGACPESRKCLAACCSEGQICVNGACAACGCGQRECGSDLCGMSCGTCTAPKACDLGPGRCVLPDVCKNVHCPAGTACDPRDGACRCDATSCPAGTACGADGRCQAGCTPACSGETPYCELGTRTCRCTPYSCAAPRICNPDTGRCESAACSPPCAGETPFCSVARGRCECTSTSCPPGKVCGVSTGQCETVGCSPPCGGETPYCSAVRGRCECITTSCPPGKVCGVSTGQCETVGCSPPCGGETPTCDPSTSTCRCTATSCGAGKSCDAQGTCRASLACDPAWQTPCAANEGCYPDGVGGFRCAQAGSLQEGSRCSGDSDCVPGAGCLSLTGTPLCTAFCDPVSGLGCHYEKACEPYGALWVCQACPAERECSGSCCPEGSTCSTQGVVLCATGPSCDPFSSGACPAGQGCYLDSLIWASACLPAGSVATGAPCSRSQDCLPGHGCFSVGGDRRCLKLCPLSGSTASGCAAGEACMEILDIYTMGLCVDCPSPCGAQCCRPGQACVNGSCNPGPSCSPVTNSGCSSSQGCYYDYALFSYVCLSRGTKPERSACNFDWECQPGLACLGSPTAVCQPYCDPMDPQCPPHRTCNDFGDGFGWCG